MARTRWLVWILLAAGAVAPRPASAGEGEGIVWETDLAAGLARAAREGRPVLFAVNALESEGANRQLREVLYRSAAWGAATREYVCFVANPDRHGGTTCDHYAGIPCEAHQQALRYIAHRLDPVSGALISPQHVVFEPDGDIAFRKEYYERVVSPALLDALWVRVSPELAYETAGAERADRVDALGGANPGALLEDARALLRSGDELAAAVVLRAIDFETDDARRRTLLTALDATPRAQLAVVDLLADDVGSAPDQRPGETLVLARALCAADRESGTRLLARIAVRTQDATLRRQAFDLWLEDPAGGARVSPSALPPAEGAAYVEPRLLTGSAAPAGYADTDAPEPMRRRLLRARARRDAHVRLALPLAEALADGRPGPLRAALLEAEPAEVRAQAAGVRETLRERPETRVRYAAAIALLGAGLDEGGRVAPTVWEAVSDPLEGPEARREAVRRLGEDPGANADVWREAVSRALEGRR